VRLKWKLRLYYGALLVVLLSFLGIATSGLVRREFERERQRRESEAAYVARRLLDERLAAIDSAVARVARDLELTALAQHDLAASRDLMLPAWTPIAGRLAATYSLPLLKILDAEGRVLSSAHWPAAYNINDSPGLVLALEAESSARLSRDRDAGGEFLAIESPRWLTRARRHVVIGGVRADSAFVADLSERAGLPMQLDLQGAWPQPTAGVDSAFAMQDSTAGASPAMSRAPWWARMRQTAMNMLSGESPEAGSAWVPLPASPAELRGGVRLAFDRRGLFDLQRRLVQTFAVAGLMGAVVAWLLSWWISNRVTRPLEQLADGVAVLAEGGTPQPIRVEASAEVRNLVQAFNGMAESLAASRERLRRAERIAAWREVARRVAHEIKNSLAPIQISVDNVARSLHTGRGDLPALVDESASTVRGEVEALTRLVNAFNEMARLPDPEPAPARIAETWERASTPFRDSLRLDARGLDAVPELLYDGDQVRRALHNLVLNAQEAGATRVSLEARALPKGGWELAMVDDGPGVAAADHERIFEPYFTRKPEGTGLGLAIVYKICTDHGWSVRVRSPVDTTAPANRPGTAFVIGVPARAGGGARGLPAAPTSPPRGAASAAADLTYLETDVRRDPDHRR
jgi:signal transduction histidine kinase